MHDDIIDSHTTGWSIAEYVILLLSIVGERVESEGLLMSVDVVDNVGQCWQHNDRENGAKNLRLHDFCVQLGLDNSWGNEALSNIVLSANQNLDLSVVEQAVKMNQ